MRRGDSGEQAMNLDVALILPQKDFVTLFLRMTLKVALRIRVNLEGIIGG